MLPANSASILIVDDDDIVRTIMCAELEAEGYRVTEAKDGLEGCEACWMAVPDLVICRIGTVTELGWRRNWRQSSKPSILGMMISQTTKSGIAVQQASHPSKPSLASVTM